VSPTARIRPARAAAVVGALIGAVALTGCGAGQVAQTAEQVAAVGGANATVGTIAVRNAEFEFDGPVEGAFVYPVRGNAPLEMFIVNSGATADRLVAARSPVADSVQISGTTEIPAGRALRVEGAAPVTLPAPAAPDAESPAPQAPTPPAAEPAPEIAPAPTAAAEPGGERQASIVLTGLREEIQAGINYPLVLTFERAGELHIEVPVASPHELRHDESH
jgi:copper(I)-binding protein